MLLRRSLLDSEGCVGRLSLWVATLHGFVTNVAGFGPLNFGVRDMGGVGSWKVGVGRNFGLYQKKTTKKNVVLNVLLFNDTLQKSLRLL